MEREVAVGDATNRLLMLGVSNCSFDTVLLCWKLSNATLFSGWGEAWLKICEISRKEFQMDYERLGTQLEEKVCSRFLALRATFTCSF